VLGIRRKTASTGNGMPGRACLKRVTRKMERESRNKCFGDFNIRAVPLDDVLCVEKPGSGERYLIGGENEGERGQK
jgi:hypothetical protein